MVRNEVRIEEMTLADAYPYISVLGALACAALGAFVLSRNWKSAANRTFAFGMAAISLMELGAFLGYGNLVLAGDLLLPVSWLLFSLQNVRKGSLRSSGMERVWIVATCSFSVLFFFLLSLDLPLPGPVDRHRVEIWCSVFMVLSLTLLLSHFEAVLRDAGHAERWKIKFLLLGAGAILVVRIFVHSHHLLFPSETRDFSAITSSAVLLGCALITFSLVRHQVLDVNVFVSRYFVYRSFTVFAIGLYLLAVGVTAGAIRFYGGTFGYYWVALFVLVSALTLLVVLLSTTVRKKAKMFINRNFYRNRYDYHKEWLTLTERLSSKIGDRELIPPIAELFRETLWTEKTVVWLCDEAGEEFKAVSQDGQREEAPARWDRDFVRYLQAKDYPLSVDELGNLPESASWGGETVGRFRSAGVAVLAPLNAGGRIVGVMGLAEPRSGHPMDREDFELINTVARQAASSFLNAGLSRNLVLAKEMETFHAFSAFVMHDMKNFVSMLSLVLHNARGNFGDPEFRADAMQSISQTVEKMKRMMDRLAVLSRSLEVERTSTDLNEVARVALSEMDGALRSKVVREFGDIPPVAIDPVQMRKVVTNLLLNAEEAAGAKGEIRLSTAEADGCVVLTVSDDGCGMPPEFIEQHLFKPFSTTKSGGFGIGLYQVKGIVEAHGGKIEVDSDVGRGSSFRVLLPTEKV